MHHQLRLLLHDFRLRRVSFHPSSLQDLLQLLILSSLHFHLVLLLPVFFFLLFFVCDLRAVPTLLDILPNCPFARSIWHDQPMSKSFCCTQPSLTGTNFPATIRCTSVHHPFVHFRSWARGRIQPNPPSIIFLSWNLCTI